MESFTINDVEERAMKDWISKHRPCGARIGTIGGRLSYIFVPTSIGVVFKINCSCGKEADLTDYESW